MATIQVRIPDEDKKAAEKVLHIIGIDMTTLVRALIKRVARRREVPFPLEARLTENGFTPEFEEEVLEASREAEKGINLSPAFDNVEDAIAWLNAPDDSEDDE